MRKEENAVTDAWHGLASEAVARSVAKLSRISSGTWRIKDIEAAVSDEALLPPGEEPGAGVIFTVAGPGSLRALITFRSRDVEAVSRCFLGYSFVKMSSMNKAEELLASEVGNILFNSFLSVISARTGWLMLPSVPHCIQGGLDIIDTAFRGSPGLTPGDAAARLRLTLSCKDGEAECSVLLAMERTLLSRLFETGGAS
jgi:chemotaxis protein CheY-P-specific phosphatase CheC